MQDTKVKKKEIENIKVNVDKFNKDYDLKNAQYHERQDELLNVTGVYPASVASKEEQSRSPKQDTQFESRPQKDFL